MTVSVQGAPIRIEVKAPQGPAGPAGPAGTTSWAGITGKPTSFTPSAHSHGNITNDGRIGTLSGRALVTTTGGAITTISREGIDTRSSFPNAEVTAATVGVEPFTLVKRNENGLSSFRSIVCFTDFGTGYYEGDRLAQTNTIGGVVEVVVPSSLTANVLLDWPIQSGKLASTSEQGQTFLSDPSSQNLADFLGDSTGNSGGFVRAEGATLLNPTLEDVDITSIQKNALDLIYANQSSSGPAVAFFEDFLGNATTDLNWEITANGGTDTNGPIGATNVLGLMQMETRTASGGFRGRNLRVGPTVVNGIVLEACFAIPSFVNMSVDLGVQRPAAGFNVGVIADTAVNGGQWTFRNGLGNNTLIVASAPQNGNFITGKKYRVRIQYVSTTFAVVRILESDAGFVNWVTIFDGGVSTPAQDRGAGVSNHGSPNIGCTNGNDGLSKSIIVDWFSYYNPSILR